MGVVAAGLREDSVGEANVRAAVSGLSAAKLAVKRREPEGTVRAAVSGLSAAKLAVKRRASVTVDGRERG